MLRLIRRLAVRLSVAAFQRLGADTAGRLGGSLGVAAFHLGIRRSVVRDNLRTTLGMRGWTRRAVARKSYATVGANFLELFTVGSGHGPEQGVETLMPTCLERLRDGRGKVLLSLHIGTWDMSGHATVRWIGPTVVYAKAQHNAELDQAINQQRNRAGMEVVMARHGQRTGAVNALRALRAGKYLGLLADQKPSSSEGVAAHFLGRPTLCHSGPAFFARRAGTVIFPAACIRIGAGRSRFYVGRPLAACDDDQRVVQAGMDRLSAMIAAVPGQYFWHHRRFRKPAELPARPVEPWRATGVRLWLSSALE